MVREIIKTTVQDVIIHLPKEYLNTSIEILAFPISESGDASIIENATQILAATAGLLEGRGIDPVEWQTKIRDEWNERK